MDVNSIRDVVRQEPFRPFVLRMNDGREFRVPHPEWLAVRPFNVIFEDEREFIIHLEPMLIASLQIERKKHPSEDLKQVPQP